MRCVGHKTTDYWTGANVCSRRRNKCNGYHFDNYSYFRVNIMSYGYFFNILYYFSVKSFCSYYHRKAQRIKFVLHVCLQKVGNKEQCNCRDGQHTPIQSQAKTSVRPAMTGSVTSIQQSRYVYLLSIARMYEYTIASSCMVTRF